MSRFLSKRFDALKPYTPGEQPQDMAYVKLNTNESPYPPAPGVMAAVSREEVSRLNLYSDPTARALEDAIAAYYGVDAAQVIAGNGSDEILAFCFQAFCDGQVGACFADITYGFYKVYAQLYGVDAKIIPLAEDFSLRPEDYYGAGRTILIANPNAPTGISLPAAAIETVIRENPDSLVIIDEAYVDYGGESVIPLVSRYDNLLVVCTFSKSRNLAGARLGFAIGQPALISDLRAMKYSFNPYNINRLSMLAGCAAMADETYFQQCTSAVAKTRDETTLALKARGFTLTQSSTNFLFAKPPKVSGKAYYLGLKKRGVLVRHFATPRLEAYARITVGTPEQMQTLLAATDDILEDA